jgi:GNAT superfamily N-acetyltransferase
LPEVELGYRWKEIWEFDDGWTMAVEQANSYYPEFKRGWLRLPDGTPIGMIHWSTKDAEPCICDIEVRDEYRGQGLAKRLIHSVEDQIGGRLHTTGSFTPEGRAALAAATPQASGYPARQHDFRSMTFIHDWDALQTNS